MDIEKGLDKLKLEQNQLILSAEAKPFIPMFCPNMEDIISVHTLFFQNFAYDNMGLNKAFNKSIESLYKSQYKIMAEIQPYKHVVKLNDIKITKDGVYVKSLYDGTIFKLKIESNLLMNIMEFVKFRDLFKTNSSIYNLRNPNILAGDGLPLFGYIYSIEYYDKNGNYLEKTKVDNYFPNSVIKYGKIMLEGLGSNRVTMINLYVSIEGSVYEHRLGFGNADFESLLLDMYYVIVNSGYYGKYSYRLDVF